MTSVGLCMIVKNEAHVIERCLGSVRPFVDHWTIVDTGSTDGTQELIRALLGDIPGHLHERPWRDFGHNRSEALALARPHADYSFVIDADEVFEAPAGFHWPELTADMVQLQHRTGTTTYRRASLVANRLAWRYRGVLHEYLDVPGVATTSTYLDGPVVSGFFDGGRSQGVSPAEKYARDALVLEAALAAEPDDARYQYYLARSYRDSGQLTKALEAFRRRAIMGGFDEEVADSLFEVARHLETLQADPDEIVVAYLNAWEHRPSRAEALTELARYAREAKRFPLARLVAQQAMRLPRPAGDLLWVQEDVYSWRSEDEFAVASYWTGHYADSAAACRHLLAGGQLPAEQRARVVANLDFAQSRCPAEQPGLLPAQRA
jgi:tetratricopeptide (TPR) repeat protein